MKFTYYGMRTNATNSIGHAMQLLLVFRCPDCIADLNLDARDCRDLGLPLFCTWSDTRLAPLILAKKNAIEGLVFLSPVE
jgi:hypothetical protein